MTPTTINPDRLYRSHEVMHLLGCRNTKFWALVKSGAFECHRLGGSVVVSGESLKAFVNSLPPANNYKRPPRPVRPSRASMP